MIESSNRFSALNEKKTHSIIELVPMLLGFRVDYLR